MQDPQTLKSHAAAWIKKAEVFPEGHPERERLLGLAQDATQLAEQQEALHESNLEDSKD